MPPAPHAISVLTQWRPATVPIAVVVALLAAYGFGTRQTKARGRSWPVARTALFVLLGVGSYVVQAVAGRDYAVVQAGVLLAAVVFVVMNTLTDAAAGVLDPRFGTAARGRST